LSISFSCCSLVLLNIYPIHHQRKITGNLIHTFKSATSPLISPLAMDVHTSHGVSILVVAGKLPSVKTLLPSFPIKFDRFCPNPCNISPAHGLFRHNFLIVQSRHLPGERKTLVNFIAGFFVNSPTGISHLFKYFLRIQSSFSLLLVSFEIPVDIYSLPAFLTISRYSSVLFFNSGARNSSPDRRKLSHNCLCHKYSQHTFYTFIIFFGGIKPTGGN